MFMPMFKTAIFLVIIWCYCFYWSHGCLEEERTHLLQIKDSINYPHGSFLDEDWVGKNCCNWSRIRCNSSSSRVILIDLSLIREERLRLWYPNASLFAAFKELEELYLMGNHIGGWAAPQAFSEMQSLRNLYIWNNNLSASIDSLRGLCELKNLRSLFLDSNNLDGRALPLCLSNLSKLEKLSLRGNDIGSYSSALTGLCELENLQFLYLDHINLDGKAFPPCLSNLSKLEELWLAENDLGSYSSALTGLCELENLQALYLDMNNLDGRALPPCLSNLSKLETLWLQGNDLGSYSSALAGLCGLSALKDLNLRDNCFNDSSLPMCMGNFSLLENLDLSWNNLSGHFGNSISGLKQLQELNLESNHLADNGISTWISNLTSLTTLFLGNNTLKGSGNMRGLCGLSALTSLYLNDNYLTSFPICMGNFSLLEDLELSRNNLSNLFGNSIAGLKQLQKLHVESNQLTDDGISPWISNLTSLAELYLGNNKLKAPDTMREPPMLSTIQERKLQEVRAHPMKDLSILLSTEGERASCPPPESPSGPPPRSPSGPPPRSPSGPPPKSPSGPPPKSPSGPPPKSPSGRSSGPMSGSSSKRKGIELSGKGIDSIEISRKEIEARLSTRFPSKAARVGDTSLLSSSPASVSRIEPRVFSPPPALPSASAPRTEPRVCPPLGAPPRRGAVPAPEEVPASPGSTQGSLPSAGERLGRFVLGSTVSRINALGTEGVINTFLANLDEISAASVCLLARAQSHGEMRREKEAIGQELSVARKKIAGLEANLVAAHEKATKLETDLFAARERATEADAELSKTRERALLGETELSKTKAELARTRERARLKEVFFETEMEAARERVSRAERGLKESLIDAFIDGYEELRGKISAAFPHIDTSGFLPSEAPESRGSGSEDTEGDSDEEEEDREEGDSD